MKLPALVYGTEAEVRKRCRVIEKSIADGATLGEALGEADDVDTHEQPGLIIVEYPGSPAPTAVNVPCARPALLRRTRGTVASASTL
jgi:hypothetical protein